MIRTTNRRLAAGVLLLMAADWLTKIWIVGSMGLGESRSIVRGWLYFVHRENPGVAFSLLANLPESVRTPLLVAVSLIGVFLFGRIILSSHDGLVRLAAAAVMGGALGNLGDRLVNGHVTDFVLFSFFPFVFNFADAAITVGGILLAARLLFSETALETAPVAEVDHV